MKREYEDSERKDQINGQQELNLQSSYNSENFYCNMNDDENLLTRDRKKRRGIIEKRRRDRINNSLVELKRLVPKAVQKETTTKLEKAEILQLTVEYIRRLNDKCAQFENKDDYMNYLNYRAIGFQYCITEMSNYLTNIEGFEMDNPLKQRLISHLQHYKENKLLKSNLTSPSVSPESTHSTTTTLQSQTITSSSSSSPIKIDQIDSIKTPLKQVDLQLPIATNHYTQQNQEFIKQNKIVSENFQWRQTDDHTAFNTNQITSPFTNSLPSFTISTYSQNAIKLSSHYNLNNDSTMYNMPSNLSYPTSYWNNSIRSIP